MALEHRLLRPSRGVLTGVFATGTAQAHLGGMGGLILRAATDGTAPITVAGAGLFTLPPLSRFCARACALSLALSLPAVALALFLAVALVSKG